MFAVLGAWWFLWSATLTVTVNADNAMLLVDNDERARTQAAGTAVKIRFLSRQPARLTIRHEEGFVDTDIPLHWGAMEFNKTLSVELKSNAVNVSIVTNPPGVQLLLDGNQMGYSSGTGEFNLPVPSGKWVTLEARKDGFQPWLQRITPTETPTLQITLMPLEMPSTPAETRVTQAPSPNQQAAPPPNQNAVASHLTRAQALFSDGKYPEALLEAQKALDLAPQNADALQLRERIGKTQAILKGNDSAPPQSQPGSSGGIGGGVYRIGGGVSQPSIIHKVEPEYSEEARAKKWQGTVKLSVIIDETGHARNITVEKALGLGLDQKAIEALEKWTFRPAMKDGKPVAVYATIEMTFHLL